MDDFTCPSVRYLTLSVFWVSLLGIPKSLVIWVRGYPKHGDTQITVTAAKDLASRAIIGVVCYQRRRIVACSTYIFKALGVTSEWGLCGMHPGAFGVCRALLFSDKIADEFS